jgi:hypothetical protein
LVTPDRPTPLLRVGAMTQESDTYQSQQNNPEAKRQASKQKSEAENSRLRSRKVWFDLGVIAHERIDMKVQPGLIDADDGFYQLSNRSDLSRTLSLYQYRDRYEPDLRLITFQRDSTFKRKALSIFMGGVILDTHSNPDLFSKDKREGFLDLAFEFLLPIGQSLRRHTTARQRDSGKERSGSQVLLGVELDAIHGGRHGMLDTIFEERGGALSHISGVEL